MRDSSKNMLNVYNRRNSVSLSILIISDFPKKGRQPLRALEDFWTQVGLLTRVSTPISYFFHSSHERIGWSQCLLSFTFFSRVPCDIVYFPNIPQFPLIWFESCFWISISRLPILKEMTNCCNLFVSLDGILHCNLLKFLQNYRRDGRQFSWSSLLARNAVNFTCVYLNANYCWTLLLLPLS